MVPNPHGVEGCLLLFDAVGKILWVSSTTPPYKVKEVVGQYAWFSLAAPYDALCQSAILRCEATGKPQMLDLEVAKIGMWRCWYSACKVGPVRIVAVAAPLPSAVQKLTNRETEICKLLATGLSGKQVAAKLSIRRTTLDNHKRNIARKLAIPTSSLVAWSAEHRHWL